MWQLDPKDLAERPHVETVSTWSRPLHGDAPIWQSLRGTITAIDNREPVTARLTYPHRLIVFPRTDKPVTIRWRGRP